MVPSGTTIGVGVVGDAILAAALAAMKETHAMAILLAEYDNSMGGNNNNSLHGFIRVPWKIVGVGSGGASAAAVMVHGL